MSADQGLLFYLRTMSGVSVFLSCFPGSTLNCQCQGVAGSPLDDLDSCSACSLYWQSQLSHWVQLTTAGNLCAGGICYCPQHLLWCFLVVPISQNFRITTQNMLQGLYFLPHGARQQKILDESTDKVNLRLKAFSQWISVSYSHIPTILVTSDVSPSLGLSHSEVPTSTLVSKPWFDLVSRMLCLLLSPRPDLNTSTEDFSLLAAPLLTG